MPKSKRRVRLTHKGQEESLHGAGQGAKKSPGAGGRRQPGSAASAGASRVGKAKRKEDSV